METGSNIGFIIYHIIFTSAQMDLIYFRWLTCQVSTAHPAKRPLNSAKIPIQMRSEQEPRRNPWKRLVASNNQAWKKSSLNWLWRFNCPTKSGLEFVNKLSYQTSLMRWQNYTNRSIFNGSLSWMGHAYEFFDRNGNKNSSMLP